MKQVLVKEIRGIIGIYKPIGPSSHRMIYGVRKITGEKRVGHAGTLDPLASGVLVVGIGRDATKRLSAEVKKEKEYLAEFTFGATSTTDDAEGEMTVWKNLKEPQLSLIKNILPHYTGEIMQIPPVFSAVKVKGKEAYKLARKGQTVKLEPRLREVKEIEILEYQWPNLKLRIVTGAGVYIRSLARDMGQELGVGGYMSSLVRIRVGNFTLEDCYTIP